MTEVTYNRSNSLKPMHWAALCAALLLPAPHSAVSGDCAVDSGEQLYPDSPFPRMYWFGSRAFAVTLPSRGAVFGTTRPDHRIAGRLFWWSEDHPVPTPTQFEITVRSLDGSPMSAVIKGPGNGVHSKEGESPWALVTGLDFPEPGCWELTGRYAGHEIKFVVQSVHRE